jgi:tRNA (uracil-5-)-methyltransferase
VLVGSTVCEQILGVPFEISPGAFFQANSRGAEVLYSIVAEWVDAGAERRDSVLLDICCGTGTIGLCLLAALRERRGAHSKARASVLGVDMCESAIVDAKRNAVRSGFGDAARFYAGKAEDVLPSLLADAFPNGAPVAALGSHNANARGSSAADTSSAVGPGAAQTAAGTAAVGARCHGARAVAFGGSYRMLVQRVAHSGFATTVTPPPDFGEREFERAQARDAAGSAAHCFGIVDPPRSGLHPNVIRAIRNCGAIKRLVYVSCNPTGSFVRDAVEYVLFLFSLFTLAYAHRCLPFDAPASRQTVPPREDVEEGQAARPPLSPG